MRLIRSFISLVIFVLLVYTVFAVPIGKRTLWQHIKAIAGTSESKELVDEVKRKAVEVLFHDGGAAKREDPDRHDPADQEDLRKLIRKKTRGSGSP
jgi:hypothetical protein